jgi:hypothetical protein
MVTRLDANASLGIPAHFTVLFPFMPPDAIGPPVLGQLERLFAAVRGFWFQLARTAWFGDEVLWLAQRDPAAFRALTGDSGHHAGWRRSTSSQPRRLDPHRQANPGTARLRGIAANSEDHYPGGLPRPVTAYRGPDWASAGLPDDGSVGPDPSSGRHGVLVDASGGGGGSAAAAG